MKRQMSGNFRTSFVREPKSLRHHPALVLNADYRPLSYFPLSLWPWQEAVKAVWLHRVDVLARYDEVVRSPSTEIHIPSVVVLKDYVHPQKRVAFTRFNLFLRDEFRCQYCGARGELTFDHVIPRSRGGTTSWQNVVAGLCEMQPSQGCKLARAGGHVAASNAAATRCGQAPEPRQEIPAKSPARDLVRFPVLGRRTGGVTRNWRPGGARQRPRSCA